MVFRISITNHKLKILLTNDDGFYAEGLQTLYTHLKSIAEIIIIAPDRERSAVGHGITMYQPIQVSVIPLDNKEHWIVNGTPSDCVKLAIEQIFKNDLPELIISGINRGPNLGNDVLYSGTVSAAIEGAMHQIPSIATSLAGYGKNEFGTAAEFIKANLVSLKKLADKATININFPVVTQYLGTRFTTLGKRMYDNVFEERKNPRGQTYYWMAGNPVQIEQDTDSDVIAIEKGFVSITPLNLDLTNYEALRHLNKISQITFDIS